MKKLKQSLSHSIFAMLLLLNLTAFGQHIKPISRQITPTGDTVTLFSVQHERELVYQLQIGTNALIELNSLYQVDSVLKANNMELTMQNKDLKALVTETKKEANLCDGDKKKLQIQLEKSFKREKNLQLRIKILTLSTTVLSIATATLLITK